MGECLKLTVGLIVKNEEKNLKKCLTKLQPLLQQIPSELIIADTGSSDRTVEIAYQYTDKVYFFEWCDDFAAARNFILSKAKGEWFFQIDADEWMESTDLIVDFFNSMDTDLYYDVSIIIRSYLSYDQNNYDEEYIKRIFRILPERKYIGSVHEYVTDMGQPKYIDNYANHYGYVTDRKIGSPKKNLRNLPILLKELERRPQDLQMLYQLAQEYLGLNDFENLEKTCIKVFKEYGDQKKDYYVIKCQWMMNIMYLSTGKYEKVIENSKQYIDSKKSFNIKTLDVIAQALDAFWRIKDYKRAIPYYEQYFFWLKQCEINSSKGISGYKSCIICLRKEEKEKKIYQFAYTLKECCQYNKSISYLKMIRGYLGDSLLQENTNLWYDILNTTKRYQELSDYYVLMTTRGNEEHEYAQKVICMLWNEAPETGYQVSQHLLKLNIEDKFLDLQKVFIKDYEKNQEVEQILSKIIKTIEVKMYYDKLLVIALENSIPTGDFINRCANSLIVYFANVIVKSYSSIRTRIQDGSIAEKNFLTIKEKYFYLNMVYFLLDDVHLLNNDIKDLFIIYIKGMMSYLKEIINPYFLSEEECENLPDEYSFIVYSYAALLETEKGNIRKSLEDYKKALGVQPKMKNIIKVMLDSAKEKADEQEALQKEFYEYGNKIKNIIRNMILSKDKASAKEALMAYEKVNPSDPEIKILKDEIQKSMYCADCESGL